MATRLLRLQAASHCTSACLWRLHCRLSEQAQRQLERGASKFEDISLGENRPTQLIKRYGNLYSESRLDAMDALDELPEMAGADDLKVKLLLSIVVVS
jgi:Mitochondria-eating protein